MSLAKLALVLSVTLLVLTACGSTTVQPAAPGASRGRVDDPRTAKADRVQCLRNEHLPVQEVGLTDLQIGAPPGGPRVAFEPTPGAAQAAQLEGQAQGAEVIGSALLYPDQGSDAELGQIESCLLLGVSG
jgi:hypothetical protein